MKIPTKDQQAVNVPEGFSSSGEATLAGCRCVMYGEGNRHWPCPIHAQAVSVPESWRKAAEGAIAFADLSIAEHYPQTALAHIRGMAGLILSAQAEPREHEPSVTEVLPTNCRERLRKEGGKYPRSGCFSCGNSWLYSGCPHQNRGRTMRLNDAGDQ